MDRYPTTLTVRFASPQNSVSERFEPARITPRSDFLEVLRDCELVAVSVPECVERHSGTLLSDCTVCYLP